MVANYNIQKNLIDLILMLISCYFRQMEQTTCCYSLVHWDTPSLQGGNSETLHREGHLLYKIYEPPGGSFIGSQILQNPVTLIYGQSWKPAYVILKYDFSNICYLTSCGVVIL